VDIHVSFLSNAEKEVLKLNTAADRVGQHISLFYAVHSTHLLPPLTPFRDCRTFSWIVHFVAASDCTYNPCGRV